MILYRRLHDLLNLDDSINPRIKISLSDSTVPKLFEYLSPLPLTGLPVLDLFTEPKTFERKEVNNKRSFLSWGLPFFFEQNSDTT